VQHSGEQLSHAKAQAHPPRSIYVGVQASKGIQTESGKLRLFAA
jgi:hypothetical protein